MRPLPILLRALCMGLMVWVLVPWACSEPGDASSCTTDVECPPYQRCRLGFCAPTASCRRDLQCPDDLFCHAARCVALDCDSDDECRGAICDETGRCRTPPTGFCRSDQDCPQSHCDLVSQRCTVPTNPCPDDGACMDAGEPPGCAESRPCPEGQVCNADSQCQRDCREIEMLCLANQRCAQGSGLCVSGACSNDDDCVSGERCHETGACLPPTCRRNQDCPDEFLCGVTGEDENLFPLICLAENGGRQGALRCIENNDCASRLCTPAGRCFQPCLSEADCTTGTCVQIDLWVDDATDPIAGLTCMPEDER